MADVFSKHERSRVTADRELPEIKKYHPFRVDGGSSVAQPRGVAPGYRVPPPWGGAGRCSVLWTVLGSRFEDRIRVPLSPAAAVRCLQGRPAAWLTCACRANHHHKLSPQPSLPRRLEQVRRATREEFLESLGQLAGEDYLALRHERDQLGQQPFQPMR